MPTKSKQQDRKRAREAEEPHSGDPAGGGSRTKTKGLKSAVNAENSKRKGSEGLPEEPLNKKRATMKEKEKGSKNEVSKQSDDSVEGAPKKKKLGKKEREKAKKRAAEGETEDVAGPALPKKRYTLFVGNLPYDITKEEVEEYFGKFTKNHVQSVRMLTDRGTGEFKGTCFLDLADSHSYEVCLRLHHTKLQDRKINVEPTVGGGGNSETRRKKLKAKTHQITKQRQKRVAKAEKQQTKQRTPRQGKEGAA